MFLLSSRGRFLQLFFSLYVASAQRAPQAAPVTGPSLQDLTSKVTQLTLQVQQSQQETAQAKQEIVQVKQDAAQAKQGETQAQQEAAQSNQDAMEYGLYRIVQELHTLSINQKLVYETIPLSPFDIKNYQYQAYSLQF